MKSTKVWSIPRSGSPPGMSRRRMKGCMIWQTLPPPVFSTSLLPASVASSVVVQVNERMNLFKSLLFAFPAVDASGKPTHLALGSTTYEVKELFASATSTSDQARLASLAMANLADDVSKETSYLSRAARSPQLSQTLVTYMLQSYYFNGSVDGNEDGLKKSFSILTLLVPSKNNSKRCSTIFIFLCRHTV